jgi:hypothetical protein
MKNKLIIIICAFALCFSLLAIPSFALENDFGGAYCFNDTLVGLGDYFTDYHELPFKCGEDSFTGFNAFYRGKWVLQYVVKVDNTITYSVDVYDSTNGWLDVSYKCIDLYSNDIGSRLYMFLLENEYIVESDYSGWYYDIYDMLHSAIFDGNDLIGYQDLTLSLLSTILCLVAFVIPIFVVLMFIKFVLSMRFI